MIKVITFCIGVDVLGFPLFHKHTIKYRVANIKEVVLNRNKERIIVHTPIEKSSNNFGVIYNRTMHK